MKLVNLVIVSDIFQNILIFKLFHSQTELNKPGFTK